MAPIQRSSAICHEGGEELFVDKVLGRIVATFKDYTVQHDNSDVERHKVSKTSNRASDGISLSPSVGTSSNSKKD
jgi:hypothetical protein